VFVGAARRWAKADAGGWTPSAMGERFLSFLLLVYLIMKLLLRFVVRLAL